MDDGKTVTSQHDLKAVVMSHFSSLFRGLCSSKIVSQLQIIPNYPIFFSYEDFVQIGSSISLDEIKEVLKLFSKDESLGPDG